MSLSTLLIGIVIAVILFALIISGKLRALVKAFLNLFVEDLASTPEGAEALFNQKEEEVEEKFRRADTVYKKVAGQRKRCKDELEDLENRLKTNENQCERLAKAGDEEGLDIMITLRESVLVTILLSCLIK